MATQNYVRFFLFFLIFSLLIGKMRFVWAEEGWMLTDQDIPSLELALKQLEDLQLDLDFSPELKKRPASCPLHSVTGHEILDELRELVEHLDTSMCARNNKPDFDYIRSLSGGLSMGMLQNMYGRDFYDIYSPLGPGYWQYWAMMNGFGGYGMTPPGGGGGMMGGGMMGGGMMGGGGATGQGAHGPADGHGHRFSGALVENTTASIPSSLLRSIRGDLKDNEIDGGRRDFESRLVRAGTARAGEEEATHEDGAHENNTGASSASAGAETANELALNSRLMMTSLLSQQQTQRLLESVLRFAQNKQCIDEMRARDLLPVAANIITHVSQLALMVPTPEAAGVGLGGMATGVGLTFLYALLEIYDRWDWNDPKQRDEFLKVSCSFYDLRRHISDTYMFYINDISMDSEIIKREKKLKQLKELLKGKNEELKNFYKKTNEKKRTFLLTKLDKNYLSLWKKIPTLLEKVAQSDRLFAKVVHVGENSSGLAEQIRKNSKEIPFYHYEKQLLSLLDRLAKDSAPLDVQELSEERVHREVLEPLEVFLLSYHRKLDEGRRSLVKEWFELPLLLQSEKVKNNREAFKLAIEQYQKIIRTYEDEVNRIETAVEIMKKIASRKSLTAYDEGTSVTYNILQEYRKVQDYIYQRKGHKFISYLANKGVKGSERFNKIYDEFSKHYLIHPPNDSYWILKQSRKQRACRMANDLIVRWKEAETAVEMGFDFIQTNISLFYPRSSWRRRVFEKYPILWPSAEKRISLQLASVNKALELKDDPVVYHHWELYFYGLDNLGLAIDYLHSNKEKIQTVQYFFESLEYKCSTVLNI